ncbi:glycosyltransferase involved in cell wall biosynthesis [Paenibacillus prosopidis]|uniref:Glycosyltransferase involved in cell wall biosynthesis n=2 Tax=Paenibacillus prosopidis TaxID=630520 RepID=A0A368W089_9BACL|nr:glycosyltransferase involved in cell wall biosynthesis [Paenibacillus prosopidis]
MRLGIDARYINGERRGMGNVLYNILLHLRNCLTNDIILYFDREIDVELKKILESLNYELVVLDATNYFIWEQLKLPKRVRGDKIDIFWHPYNTGSLWLNSIQVVSIHDVMFMKSRKVLPYSKSLQQILGRIYRKYNTPRITMRAEKIITISHHAKQDIMLEIQDVHEEKIDIVHNGCNKTLEKDRDLSEWIQFKVQYGIKDKYLFCLGAVEPRKNTIYTIEVFDQIIKRNNLDIQLVIAGLKGWETSDAYSKAKEHGISEQVIFLDYVPGEILDLLYINAYIFLFLSYYEGFGLPILEAMAFNTPVITTDVTSMPEIAGDAAIITSYNDRDKTVSDIEKLLFDQELYKDLCIRGQERVKLFTWENAALKVGNIFKTIINQRL